MAGTLQVATAQFPVSGIPEDNFQYISRQIQEAADHQAHIVHFSECCLTGYPDIDFKNCDNDGQTDILLNRIATLAQNHKIWVIVGSHYFVPDKKRPLNSLFVFDNAGEIVCRYDKRVLAGAPGEMDRAHYSAGQEPAIFEINNIRCGLVICHEWRYPELFREYQQIGVELVFHSFYDGNLSRSAFNASGLELGELIIGGERYNAANNYLWLSIANTCQAEQVFPSQVIHPDGSVANRATRNHQGLLLTEINPRSKFIDPSLHGRERIKELFPGSKFTKNRFK